MLCGIFFNAEGAGGGDVRCAGAGAALFDTAAPELIELVRVEANVVP